MSCERCSAKMIWDFFGQMEIYPGKMGIQPKVWTLALTQQCQLSKMYVVSGRCPKLWGYPERLPPNHPSRGWLGIETHGDDCGSPPLPRTHFRSGSQEATDGPRRTDRHSDRLTWRCKIMIFNKEVIWIWETNPLVPWRVFSTGCKNNFEKKTGEKNTLHLSQQKSIKTNLTTWSIPNPFPLLDCGRNLHHRTTTWPILSRQPKYWMILESLDASPEKMSRENSKTVPIPSLSWVSNVTWNMWFQHGLNSVNFWPQVNTPKPS